jgi:hypothetical protein
MPVSMNLPGTWRSPSPGACPSDEFARGQIAGVKSVDFHQRELRLTFDPPFEAARLAELRGDPLGAHRSTVRSLRVDRTPR